jgi:hypothetical protein
VKFVVKLPFGWMTTFTSSSNVPASVTLRMPSPVCSITVFGPAARTSMPVTTVWEKVPLAASAATA